MAPYISNTKQYITDNCDISHSSDNSSTVPLLSEYSTSALSSIPMSPFGKQKSSGVGYHRLHGKNHAGWRANCPVIFCHRKPKCFLTIIFLSLLSLLSVAVLYNWECPPIFQNCSINISHAMHINKDVPLINNVSTTITEEDEVEDTSAATKLPSSKNYMNPMQKLISINQHVSQTVPLNNLINYTSIKEKGVHFKINENDVMVFLHIQKTGGTTFERHLVRDLEATCTCRKKKRRKNFDEYGRRKKFFAGGCECYRPSLNPNTAHTKSTWLFSRYNTGWKCGLHADWTELTECVDSYLDTEEGVVNRRYFYMTFFRDPVTRYISEWKHIQRGATWKDSKFMCNGKPATKSEIIPCYDAEETWEGVSLKEFMACKSNLAINRQTRMLADLRQVNCYNTTDMPLSQRNKVLLESAKTNLERLAFFGITTEQAKSQYLFEDTFNLTFKVQFEAQSQHSKSDISDLDDLTLNKIRQINSLDVELFEYAQKLMKERFDKVKNDDVNFDKNYHSLST